MALQDLMHEAIANTPTYFSNETALSVPRSWLVMNAHRPLMGCVSVESRDIFIEGRHFAAIDPNCENAERAIQANLKNAAVMILHASQEEQAEMALIESSMYREKYEAMPLRQRVMAIKPLIKRVQGKGYTHAKLMHEQAKSRLELCVGCV